MIQYTPLNWYWFVGGDQSQVWSSASQAYAGTTDSTYTAWLESGGKATNIDSIQNLLAVVAPYILASGIQITSTSTSALNGTYACDVTSQQKIMAISLYCQINSSFPGGVTSYPWVDLSGTVHTFPSVTEFQAFATAVADYVAQLDFCALGQSTSLPSNAVTIA